MSRRKKHFEGKTVNQRKPVVMELYSQSEEVIEPLEKFDESVFRDVYQNLYRILNTIIEEGEKRHGDTIVLLGDRGTGKSSSLISFTNSLKERNNERLDAIRQSGVEIFVLDHVDASMLDSEEDLFDVLLAQMLRNIESVINKKNNPRESGEYNIQEVNDLLTSFDKIFKAHQDIKHQKEKGDSYESSLLALRRFADSLNLTQNFEKLVEAYLKGMLEKENGFGARTVPGRSYLVVPIDDLDMNVENGARSLEQIYRYVAVKNVIVLLTIKYSQIEYLFEKTGYNIFPMIGKDMETYKKEYVHGYASEYLDKLIPIQRRVYMPDLKRMRMANQSLNVRINKNQEISLKNALMQTIYQNTGMCFDVCGRKVHFLEPLSLREINGYFSFLNNNMENPKDMRDYIVLHRNCGKFIRDFVERIAYGKLSKEYWKELQLICELDAEGITNQLSSYLRKRTDALRYPTSYRYIYERSTVVGRSSDGNYSFETGYGEILRMLYEMSRDDREDKYFAYTILIYYTYLIQECMIRLELGTVEQRKSARVELESLLRNSWAGSWPIQLTPKIEIIGNSGQTGDVSTNQLRVNALRAWAYLEDITTIGNSDLVLAWTKVNAELKSPEEWITANEEVIRNLEWISFFFECFYSDGRLADIRLDMETSETIESILLKNDTMNFNILGFIKNSFNYEQLLDKLYGAIAQILIVKYNQKSSKLTELKATIRRHSSYYQSYVSWGRAYNNVVVPFQFTDIYYHVLHRVQKKMAHRVGTPVTKDELYDVVKEVIVLIGEELRLEQEAYGENVHLRFTDAYEQCPFVNKILQNQIDDNQIQCFNELVMGCTSLSLSSNRMARLEPGLTTSDELNYSRSLDW